MSEDRPLGRFVWYSLMTPNPEASLGFYSQIVGWGTATWQAGDTAHTVWTQGDVPYCGVMQLPEDAIRGGAVPHWLAYVSVPDVDAAAVRAVELGASVMVQPADIPDTGRFAVLQDPQGVVIAIYTSASGTPAEAGPPEIGEFSWHELVTTDWQAALAFYSQLFGWRKGETMDMGEAGKYQLFNVGAHPLGGMFDKSADMPGPPSWLYYVRVDDVAASAEQVKELGGQVLIGPMEVPGGDQIVQCMDPQGAAFALHATAA